MDWYYRVPIGLMFVYAESLPVIQSGELLSQAAAVAMGSGTLGNKAKTISWDWQKESEKFHRGKAIPVQTDVLQSAGIRVQYE